MPRSRVIRGAFFGTDMAKTKEEKKRTRQSSYTPEIGGLIAERLAKGEPLAQICRDEGMPHANTVRNWMEANPEYAVVIARARESGYDLIAADCLQIADTPLLGEEVTTKPDGTVEIKTGDMLGHRKLQIDTRLKLLAKWDPKRYGDKIEATHKGSLGVTINMTPQDEAL